LIAVSGFASGRPLRVATRATPQPYQTAATGFERKAGVGVNTLIRSAKVSVGSAGKVKKFGFAMAAAVLLFVALGTVSAAAQSEHRVRRESTATRKARIARMIDETYGHRWEAGGGGGYMRYRTGPFLRQSNEVSFWASTLYSLNPKFGILGTVQGSYGKAKIGNETPSGVSLPFNPAVSEYAFMAGPSYRFVAKEKFGVAGFVQGGLDLGKFAGASKGYTAADIGVWQGDFAPAFAAGVNLDYHVDPSFSVRVTPEYLGTTFGSTMQNSKALNVGIIYRFGKINK
jgi:hypothetical protein